MSGSHLSALQLEALSLGALPASEAEKSRDHLGACADCRRRQEELAADAQHFAQFVVPRTTAAVSARVRGASARRWAWALIPAMAIAVLVVALPRRGGVTPGPELGIKGGSALQVVARREQRVFPVSEATRLREGDSIELVVTPAGMTQLLVVGVDGVGRASLYFPPGGTQSGPIDAARRTPLPLSWTLDGSPGPERLFALFSREPVRAADALAAGERLGRGGPGAIRAATRLEVPAAAQASLAFEKDPR